uniref:Uncharacterized protein n=1 Tax=Musca domestica TaxID=7370 RepID=A0A1I8NFT5_MUSDO
MFNNNRWFPAQKWAVIVVFFCMLLSMPAFTPGHGHSHDNPSFKYSREANEGVEIHEPHLNTLPFKKGPSIDVGNVWIYSMASTLVISAAPFLILFVIPLDNSDAMRPRLKIILAFASGGLLGDAFLHLIPHATHPHHSHECGHAHEHGHSHEHSHDITTGLWVLGGIIVFLTVEKLVRLIKGENGHCHGKSETKTQGDIERFEISGYLNLAADFAHNFTDGLAIGASYLAGNDIGFITTLTILLHEVPHEIGDYAILIKSGCSRKKAMCLQLVTALGALTGNILALIGIGNESDSAPWVLPFTAGGFIYIAAVSVLPELLEESTKLWQSIKEITALLLGVGIMVFIAKYE